MKVLRQKYILMVKYLALALTLILSFFSVGLSLVIILLFNIRGIRRSVFGRLPIDTERKPWKQMRSEEYLPGKFLDIYYPEGAPPKGTILFAHGGGWISGYRKQPNNVSWYRVLVSRGFAVAAIEYSRGYTAGIDLLVDECSAAIGFLSRRSDDLSLNKSGISVMGLSAGGHLALLAGMKHKGFVKSITAYYSPCDLLDIWEASSIFARISSAAVIKRLPFKQKSREVYRHYSPIRHVSVGTPPILLVHGMKDSIVPYPSSLKMYRKLKEAGCPVKVLFHAKGRHGFEFVLKDRRTREIIEKTIDFWSTV